MLLLRDVRSADLPQLKALAGVLNSVNLPDNASVLRALIRKSAASFSGRIANPLEREYLFVLEDTARKRLWGTSMVIAQHGTREAPHIYFQVSPREHYSASIDKHHRHQTLSIGYNYDGPTEIGGLVVHPRFRSGVDKPGKQLSWVRFLFMAMHPTQFRPTVLAELLPPLLADGRSLLWESLGRKFTGLSYPEADKLSRRNKEFIKELFPNSDVYATLLPERAQRIIGKVGRETRGVERMLTRIGFTYNQRIDPFDGGPHFEAPLERILPVRLFQRVRLLPGQPAEGSPIALLGLHTRSGGFRAVAAPAQREPRGVTVPRAVWQLLGSPRGRTVGLVPFVPEAATF